jgi:hypothetical protein
LINGTTGRSSTKVIPISDSHFAFGFEHAWNHPRVGPAENDPLVIDRQHWVWGYRVFYTTEIPGIGTSFIANMFVVELTARFWGLGW